MTTLENVEAQLGGVRAGSQSCLIMLREEVVKAVRDEIGDDELIRVAELICQLAIERE